MTRTSSDTLPLEKVITPSAESDLCRTIEQAGREASAIYPLGGQTSLGFGLPAKRPGLGISLADLNQVIDYPARDMTITVEAGITMSQLTAILAAEEQILPINVPQAGLATLGGVLATRSSGSKRYGYGSLRDYVIGIRAVDGLGVPFQSGGRVVKNVAGYDLCKLLIGSLGTLGVITQVTLKVIPRPERRVLLACDLTDWSQVETQLAALVDSATRPASIELLAGLIWRDQPGLLVDGHAVASLVIGLEGTVAEVDWMIDTLTREWCEQGVPRLVHFTDQQADELQETLTEFPVLDAAPLIIQACVLPSQVVDFVKLVQTMDPDVGIESHAGNGLVIVRFSQFTAAEVSRELVGTLQGTAAKSGGHVIVLSAPEIDMTRQAMWGRQSETVTVMQEIKKKFDPLNILNPGRFVY